MLGKGYLPPTRYYRWCTERLKVRPIKNYIKELIKKYNNCVVLLGTRLKESATRDKGLKKRGYSKWMPFEGVKGAMIYAPILELSIEDVWSYLLENDPPWGMDNNSLRTLYTGGNASCSLFCGGIRFGCWVCTVVKKDKCTEGLSQIHGWEWLENLLEYRDLMLEVRNKPQNRMWRQNNGHKYLGPLNLKARKFLYAKLKELENKLGQKILSSAEEEMIHNFWGNSVV
jgi:DNA sulfur modification protein DndC